MYGKQLTSRKFTYNILEILLTDKKKGQDSKHLDDLVLRSYSNAIGRHTMTTLRNRCTACSKA